MPTWEYATLICHHEAGFLSGKNHWTWQGNKIDFIGLDLALNDRGAEGWELVTSHAQVEPDWSEVAYTFKRPAQPKS